jgi:hypothetical protein
LPLVGDQLVNELKTARKGNSQMSAKQLLAIMAAILYAGVGEGELQDQVAAAQQSVRRARQILNAVEGSLGRPNQGE